MTKGLGKFPPILVAPPQPRLPGAGQPEVLLAADVRARCGPWDGNIPTHACEHADLQSTCAQMTSRPDAPTPREHAHLSGTHTTHTARLSAQLLPGWPALPA